METRRLLSGAVLYFDAAAAAAASPTGQPIWDTSTPEWASNAGLLGQLVAWNNSDTGGPETAIFPAGDMSVSVAYNPSGIDVDAITFGFSNVAVSGGPLSFPSGGTITVQSAGWGEIDSDISGGPLTINGSGTLILSGSNTYSGAVVPSAPGGQVTSTYVTSGTLQVGVNGNASSLGTGAVSLSTGTTLAFDLGQPTTFTNNISLSSGNQSITILGSPITLDGSISGTGLIGISPISNPVDGGGDGNSGTGGVATPDLTLGASNSFTGGATISGGASVAIAPSGSVDTSSITVTPGSTLAADPAAFNSPTSVDDDGALDLNNPSPDLAPAPTPITLLGSGNLNIVGGTLTLVGSNNFTGSTSINYGTLSLQNSGDVGTGAGYYVVVGAGSTLDGLGGTQGDVTVENGGFLTPGTRNGIGEEQTGTLDTNNVTLQTGSAFEATVNNIDAGTYDLLNVTGSVTINNGATLDLSGTPALVQNQSFTLISTTQGISGTFTNLVTDPSNPNNPPTITVNGQTFSVSEGGGSHGNDDLILTLVNTAPTLSIVQQDATVTAGEPTNFELTAVGGDGVYITGWSVDFGDGSSQVFTAGPNLAAGGIYTWDVQHTYTSDPTLGFTVGAAPTHSAEYNMGLPVSIHVQVNPPPVYVVNPGPDAPPTVIITGLFPQSSTQILVFFDTNVSFDSSEVAAMDVTAGATTYTVVGAGGALGATGSDPVLVSGLTPDNTYDFLVYAIDATQSLCSIPGPVTTATTFSTPTVTESISATQSTYTGTIDGAALNLVSYSWSGFDASGNPIQADSTSSSSNISSAVFATNPAYVTFDATAVSLFGSSEPSAFDSVTYYNSNFTPTIVVTGTSGDDTFNVSLNSNGQYIITGSVTPIAPFYASQIHLEVYGRGGNDTLFAGAGTDIVMSPVLAEADGTNLSTKGPGEIFRSNPAVSTPTPPPAGLVLPAPGAHPAYDTIPTPGDTFNPPLVDLAADPSPLDEITQATATAEPGDVIALTAVDINPLPAPQTDAESAGTTFWVYGQATSGNADWEQAAIISAAPAGTVDEPGVSPPASTPLTAISIQLPSSLPAHSAYLLYEVNGNAGTLTYSKPYVINQPQIWWTDQNNSYAGGKVSLFGTNLSYGVSPQPYTDQSWVYLFQSDVNGTITPGDTPIILPVSAVAPDPTTGDGAMDVNPYKVDFNLPSTINPGYYQVEVYNGHGGWYGMSIASSGADSASLIDVKPALTLVGPPVVPLAYAYCYSQGYASPYSQADLEGIWVGGDASSDLLSPAAVNDAINWAESYYTTNTAGTGGAHVVYSYVGIQLPPGEIDVTTANDTTSTLNNFVQMQSYVHLVGAGDTGSPLTGTVVVGAAPELDYLIKLYSYDGNQCVGAALSDMTLRSNGNVTESVVYNNSTVVGFTIQNVTIDATSDIPANPSAAYDVEFSQGGSSNLQFLDSTFIGQGIDTTADDSGIDNCHFIACGAAGAQIESFGSTQLTVTRCTDTSLVNNIISPGGNVEDDSGARLVAVFEAQPGLYFGDNTTSDLYYVNPEDSGHGLNGGEQISVEAYPHNDSSGFYATNFSVAVYQNTLSGDGAESFLANGCGVLVEGGPNVVIADNDISNENAGIAAWNPGNYPTIQPFQMIVDNSLHNVYVGLSAGVLNDGSDAPEQVPYYLGNSYIDNIIACVKAGPTQWSSTTKGISFNPAVQSTTPPSIVMNIFYDDIVTGADVGFRWSDDAGITNGPTLLWNCSLFSNGATTSSGIKLDDPSDEPLLTTVSSQGFWS